MPETETDRIITKRHHAEESDISGVQTAIS
jgi:hypothetical protein